MMPSDLRISSAIAILGGGAVYLLGGVDQALIALLAFMAMDFIFGVFHAIADKRLSTNKLLLGVVRKLGLFALIAMAVLLSRVIMVPLRELVVFFLLAHEGLSILSHMARFGIPLPPVLKEALEGMRKARDDLDHRA